MELEFRIPCILSSDALQELLCQYRSMIMKLEDDVRISGGTRNVASGENQARAQELKDQMAQLTQENVMNLLTNIIIRLVACVGKMKQIWCRDWLPARS